MALPLAQFFLSAIKKLTNKYNNSNCQKIIDKSVVLNKMTIISLLNPCGEIKYAVSLPAIKRTIKPITGEKITGSKIGRRITPFIDLKG